MEHDAVVVGAGPAGCAAAVLLARSGWRVTLLEAHRDPAHYKRLCTHFIQSSALPVLQRLGADAAIEEAGGVRNELHLWTRYGWVHEEASDQRPAHGYNIRRQVLDPLLRQLAADTPGVTLQQAAKVRTVLRTRDRVTGVEATVHGAVRQYAADLLVGADGRASTVAGSAGLDGTAVPNGRFGYFAHYRGIEVPHGWSGQFWLAPPDAAYAFRNDDGITLLAAMPGHHRWRDFAEDREAALLATVRSMPDAPDLSAAVRVGDVVGTKDCPSITRKHVAAPGVALVGDAGMVGDPLWGVGCGFALQSAAWLADAVPKVRGGADLDRALARYDRTHRSRLGMHQRLMTDFSSGRDFNAVERLLYAAAPHDPAVAQGLVGFGTRNASPLSLFSPSLLARAAWTRRHLPSRPDPESGSPAQTTGASSNTG